MRIIRVMILTLVLSILAPAFVTCKDFPLSKLRADFATGRIIDGIDAQRGEAPYIVSMKFLGSHFCAGSIIKENWIVTAAHCLTFPIFDVVGGLHIRSQQSKEAVQVRKVKSNKYFIKHSKYDGGVGPNDIGLIYIPDSFKLNGNLLNNESFVRKIELPSNENSIPDGNGILFGWGTDRSGGLPDTLQKLDTKIIGYDNCKQELPSDAPLDPTNICSHYNTENHYTGACSGDSGGPLIKTDARNRVKIVGIVSWGYTPCTNSTYPSVYTSVSAYIKWIYEQIELYKPPI